MIFFLLVFAYENNEALRKLYTLEKWHSQVETKAKDVVEALERCRQEAQEHEEKLAAAAASREKAMAEQLMAAAKALSGELSYFFSCLNFSGAFPLPNPK